MTDPISSGLPGPGGKMSVQAFGDALIRTRDLDPAYVGLVGLGLTQDQMARWLLAYWCFYHVGSACWLSECEGEGYWTRMTQAAANVTLPPAEGYQRWPRAPERRHFRGQKCVDAVENYRAMSGGVPEFLVRGLTSMRRERDVMNVVQEWPLFGPWIAFKVADMLERCAGVPISFSPNAILMYKGPREALKLVPSVEEGQKYEKLLQYFSSRRAPPAEDRFCGPQEVETILCKWGSYLGGHYHLGKDIQDHTHALRGWGTTAMRMELCMPRAVE